MTVADDVTLNVAPDEAASLRRIVWSSVIGTAVEWYDFLIYGTATALVFNKVFFAAGNATLATIAAFGTYAVGFLARPLGAAIFGHYGDRVGRKAMLAITIMVMGLGTFLIGLLPTYQQIGIAAPVLLIGLRFLQGIGLGGEWGGAVLMVVENCPTHRRGLLGSMVQVGNPIGNLAAIGMFALVASLPESDFMAYGWRIPFLISILLVGVGLYIRLNMEETAAFRQVQAKKEVASLPLLEIFRHHRRPFFTAVGLKISEIAYASIGGVFVMSYATANLGLPRAVVLNGAFARRWSRCLPSRCSAGCPTSSAARLCSMRAACSRRCLPSLCSGCSTPAIRPSLCAPSWSRSPSVRWSCSASARPGTPSCSPRVCVTAALLWGSRSVRR